MIASLFIPAIGQIQEYELAHLQDRLIDRRVVIPDFPEAGAARRPDSLYGFGRSAAKPVFPIDWRVASSAFSFDVPPSPEKKHISELSDKLAAALQNIQNRVDIAIENCPDKCCMLPWIERINSEGWGDYDSYNGGFGSFVDPRTGNRIAVYIRMLPIAWKKGEEPPISAPSEWQLSFTYALINLQLKLQ